ncbi:MAG: molybdopterin-dependent oxidoreductase, partial [Bacteroidota bacterium]|nr:molybdopterin-dependent oxidoreductase [Bacteroidota bacterium]
MSTFKTTCARDCYDSCGMIVTTEKNEIISIKGDAEHPVTKGFLCPRGTKDIQRLNTNRIQYPSIKEGANFNKISWQSAIKIISEKLQTTISKFGAEKVLYLDYSGNEGLYNNIFAKRLWYSLGATFTAGALCTASGHEAINLHYGSSYGVQPTELPNKKLIVFWGFNAAVNAPHFWKLALEAKKNNKAKIVVIDPIKTLSAKKADLFIQIYPGTDTALAYS